MLKFKYNTIYSTEIFLDISEFMWSIKVNIKFVQKLNFLSIYIFLGFTNSGRKFKCSIFKVMLYFFQIQIVQIQFNLESKMAWNQNSSHVKKNVGRLCLNLDVLI